MATLFDNRYKSNINLICAKNLEVPNFLIFLQIAF